MSLIKYALCGLCLLGISQTQAEEAVPTTRILYVRHGEVPGNNPDPRTYIYTGSGTDDSLTELGRIQAKECAQFLSYLQQNGHCGTITALYASDLTRAVETAEPISQALGLSIHLRQPLREINWGCADGQLVQTMSEEYDSIVDQIEQQYPERKTRWDYLPVFEGAETYNALLNRTLTELKRIAELHPGETVVIVGHGRVLKTLIADLRDSEEKIPYPANCGIAEFTYSPNNGLRFIQILKREKHTH